MKKNQDGYTLLLYIMVVSILTLLSLGIFGRNLFLNITEVMSKEERYYLYDGKETLITFSLLIPYTYLSNKNSDEIPSNKIHGTGYFNCPINKDKKCSLSVNTIQSDITVNSHLGAGLTPKVDFGYLPKFNGTRLFDFSTSVALYKNKPIVYILDKKYNVHNKLNNSLYPINIYLDTLYLQQSNNTYQPFDPLASGTICDQIGFKFNNILSSYQNSSDAHHDQAKKFIDNHILDYAFISNENFVNRAHLPSISINNKIGYVFSIIYPGKNKKFETIINEDIDGNVSIVSSIDSDDIIMGLHFLEWADINKNFLCNHIHNYSDLASSDPSNGPWLMRKMLLNNNDFTNGSNWIEQIFPNKIKQAPTLKSCYGNNNALLTSPYNPKSISICNLKITYK